MKRFIKYFSLISLFVVMGMFCVYSDNVDYSVRKALKLCADVLIPSLLPCIAVSNIIIKLNLINLLPKKIQIVFLFFLSLVSGYPVGANLLNECVKSGQLTKKDAKKILPAFINAGPGFIINMIGNAVLGQKELGYILFVSQCSSSFFIFMFTHGFKIKLSICTKVFSLSTALSECVSQAFNSIKNICIYVLLFFSFREIIAKVFGNTVSHIFTFFGEVTSAVLMQNNVYIISVLLSWCGICVYLQVLSVTEYNVSVKYIVLFRMLHGILSVIITKILLTVFDIKTAVFSNIQTQTVLNLPDSFTYLVLVVFCIICFLSSINRKSSGKFEKDLI